MWAGGSADEARAQEKALVRDRLRNTLVALETLGKTPDDKLGGGGASDDMDAGTSDEEDEKRKKGRL